MYRGTTTFVCKYCGHKFEGLDIEDYATVESMPMPCPKCGHMSTPAEKGGILRFFGL